MFLFLNIFYGPKMAKLSFLNFGPILSSQVRQLHYNTDRCRIWDIRPSPLSIRQYYWDFWSFFTGGIAGDDGHQASTKNKSYALKTNNNLSKNLPIRLDIHLVDTNLALSHPQNSCFPVLSRFCQGYRHGYFVSSMNLESLPKFADTNGHRMDSQANHPPT